MTEDHLSSVNLTHSVHEWMQVGPRDQAVGKRVMPLCFLPHLRVLVVAAAAALLQAEEEAEEGVEEHSQMKVAEGVGVGEEEEEHSQMKVAKGVVVVVVEEEEEEEEDEENPHMKVVGVAKH